MSDFPAAPPPSMGLSGRPAAFGARLVAWLIDVLIAAALYIPGYVLLFIGGGIGGGFGTILALLGGLMLLAGFVAVIMIMIVGQGSTGQTPGKRSQGIRLQKGGTGQPIGGLMVFVRGLLAGVLSSFCYIGHLWMLWDSEQKTLYDKILDNEVVVGQKGGLMPLFPDGKPF